MDKTLYRRRAQYQDRWSAFGSDSGIVAVTEMLSARQLKELEIFAEFSEKFLARISPDVSVADWKKGAVLFEEGSYIDLAFVILEGEVDVWLDKQRAAPIFSTERTIAAVLDQKASAGPPASGSTLYHRQTQRSKEKGSAAFLSTMDFDLPRGETVRLGEGEIFGEIGALNGWPMSVTAAAANDCRLIQIRVPALRLMKRASKAFQERIDRIYRQRALNRQLVASPLFRSCSEDFVEQLAERVSLLSCEPDQVVVEEGKKADAFYLVRSGFLKLSKRTGRGRPAISYLSKGMTFGEVELLIDEIHNWTLTVSSVGYSELVEISSRDFRQVLQLFPALRQPLWEQAMARIRETGAGLASLQRSEFVEFSLDRGLVEGSSILVIDLNHCTRCDECVRACSDTHGGRPRFVREGEKYDNLLIARACYHCQDPVCLIGCPTGAIRRAQVGQVVEINEDICIGCGNCASNCPYDAIVNHPTGVQWGEDALPKSLRGQDRQVASKCDLCHDTGHGPACVHNCPQGCAFRVGSTEEFQRLLGTGR